MSVEDFAKYYEGVGICKVVDGNKYNSIRCECKGGT